MHACRVFNLISSSRRWRKTNNYPHYFLPVYFFGRTDGQCCFSSSIFALRFSLVIQHPHESFSIIETRLRRFSLSKQLSSRRYESYTVGSTCAAPLAYIGIAGIEQD